MKTVHMCGTRGLGDIIASTAFILDRIKQDTHLVFHYPEDKGYKQKFDFLMEQFVMPDPHKVTYEVQEGWSTVSYKVAVEKFGKEKENDEWYFSSKVGYGRYRAFKTRWIANNDGPIGLVTSHMTQNGEVLTEKNYPMYERLWDPETNQMLEDLIDDRKYVRIGGGYDPLELNNQVKKMQKCRRVIGFDTSWVHIANCMRVPYVLCLNRMSRNHAMIRYRAHPSLTVIETEQIANYL